MKPVTRCKMFVTDIWQQKDSDGTIVQEKVKLSAVIGPEGSENAEWSKWTPSANFEIYINNPDAMNQLSRGNEYFVDFTPCRNREGT